LPLHLRLASISGHTGSSKSGRGQERLNPISPLLFPICLARV
jgi:hypothetical protein